MVQWLRLCASSEGGMSLIPGEGTRISHATWQDQKKIKSSQNRLYASWKLHRNRKLIEHH